MTSRMHGRGYGLVSEIGLQTGCLRQQHAQIRVRDRREDEERRLGREYREQLPSDDVTRS